MITTNRACLLALCAMLPLLASGRALAEDPVIKPAITGLVSTGSKPDPTGKLNPLAQLTTKEAMGIFGGLVVQASWKDVQPTEDVFDTSVIDKVLAPPKDRTVVKVDNVTDYNAAVAAANLPSPNNRQIGVRLRIFAGCTDGESDAPDWAINSDPGFKVTVTAEYDSKSETCTFGKFWDPTSNYAKSWRKFQDKLAAKYDTNPLIQEVSVTSCTSSSAEPFFLNLKTPKNSTSPAPSAAFNAIHFDDPTYQDCLERAIDDYGSWKTTRLEFAINEFSGLNVKSDIVVSERIMRRCRLTVGPRCILSNHDLDATTTPTTILPILVFERKFGPNITFQTYHVVPVDFEGTLRKGVSLGASSIEVWQEPALGSFEGQSRATLANWAAMFQPQ
jgi:hypothetical protein